MVENIIGKKIQIGPNISILKFINKIKSMHSINKKVINHLFLNKKSNNRVYYPFCCFLNKTIRIISSKYC